MSETAALKIANNTIEIATLPEVTMKIIEVVQDPRSTAHDLHEIVKNDPALSSRVLRVVNSAFYGLPGQIGSIDRAIMLLGLNAVKNIAIAASLSKMFRSGATHDDLTGKDLWTHSVAVGAANKLITQAIGLALPDEAFLAGLIHDIGIVAELQCCSQEIPKIVEAMRAGGLDILTAEEKVLGANHQEIGALLAAKWKFPRSFQFVTGYHHNPTELAQENRLLACVTYVADHVCTQKGLGIVKIQQEYPPLDQSILEEIKLSESALDDVFENVEAELEVVRTLIE